jgi:hypothetical protein
LVISYIVHFVSCFKEGRKKKGRKEEKVQEGAIFRRKVEESIFLLLRLDTMNQGASECFLTEDQNGKLLCTR